MKVQFSFSLFFSNILGIDNIEIDITDGSSVEEALNIFFSSNPVYYRKLEEKNLFLLGDFRAIYHIDRLVVKKDHILHDGDKLNILKAYIGG